MDEPRNNEDCVSISSQSEEVISTISNRTMSYPTRKERKRTETMNLAFAHLRDHIPNVPTDTKLSKIKTLRLAISYIRYLMEVLEGEKASLAGKRDRNIAMNIANQCDTKEKRKKGFVSINFKQFSFYATYMNRYSKALEDNFALATRTMHDRI